MNLTMLYHDSKGNSLVGASLDRSSMEVRLSSNLRQGGGGRALYLRSAGVPTDSYQVDPMCR